MAILRGIDMPGTTIVIRVDIPALSALVDHLTGRQQQQIDALAQQVTDLTTQLEVSRAHLAGEVHAHPTRQT